jgi:hypothetical protein
MVLQLNSIQKTPVLAHLTPVPIVQPTVAVLSARDMAIIQAARMRQVARR